MLKTHSNAKLFPAIYKNETLTIHPSDMPLAFLIQTKASQRDWGNKNIKFKWHELASTGMLDKTTASNSRVAKKQIRKKMTRLKANNIISDWQEFPGGIMVTPVPQKLMKNKQTT